MLSPAAVNNINVTLSKSDSIQIVEFNSRSEITRFLPFRLEAGEENNLVFRVIPKLISPFALPLALSPLAVGVSYEVEGLGRVSLTIPLRMDFIEWSDAAPAQVGSVFAHFYCAKAKDMLEEAHRCYKSGNPHKARERIESAIDFIGSRELSEYENMKQGRIPRKLDEELLSEPIIMRNQSIFANLHPKLFDIVKRLVQEKQVMKQ
jgi:hypothetical protein